MVGKSLSLLIVLQLSLCMVQSQEQDEDPKWVYLCPGSLILCKYGFIVEIMDIKYGRVDGGCSPATIDSAVKKCETNANIGQELVQGDICRNKTWCDMISVTGNDVCFDGKGTSNYGAVHYFCKFGGYEGRSSPPTTTLATTTTATTTVKTTTEPATTTTKPPSTSETQTFTPLNPKQSTTNNDDQTTPPPTEPTDTTTTTKSPTTAAGAASEGMKDEDRTKLIIGVSVGALVLILLIIVLVECKRQSRKRRHYTKAQTPDILADNDTSNIIQPVTDEERAMVSGTRVEYNDENNAVTGERERRFKKKSETNDAFEGENTAQEIQTKIENHSPELQNGRHLNGRRDSGVGTLMAEEINRDLQGDGYENSEELENTPTPPESPSSSQEPQFKRHVSFSDMAINTDSLHPASTENVYDNPSGGQTQLPQYDRNPHLDPNVSGPSSEGEVLY